jgi:hypothetical protein
MADSTFPRESVAMAISPFPAGTRVLIKWGAFQGCEGIVIDLSACPPDEEAVPLGDDVCVSVRTASCETWIRIPAVSLEAVAAGTLSR